MKVKLFSCLLITILLSGIEQLYAVSFRTTPQDTVQVTAESGKKDSTLMRITKITPGSYDTVIVDSLWYKSTGLPQGTYFGESDSLGFPVPSLSRKGFQDTLVDSLSSVKYNITFFPPAVGSYKDTLIILTKRYKNGFLGNEYDTLLVRGTGYQVYYLNRPDSVYIGSLQTGQADSIKTIVINTGRSGDTIVVDSIRFKSNFLDSTAYFSIRDSLGRRHSGQAYINKLLLPRPDSLKFYVRFKSLIPGWFADRVIIRYRILQQSGSRLFYDTLAVGAQATSPPHLNRYAAFPDSFSLNAQTGQRDSSLGKIWNTGVISDTVIIDSLRFKSAKNDTALPFFATDSIVGALPDFINRSIYPYNMDTLRFRVKFKPTVAGSFRDTLFIYYRIGVSSSYIRSDTMIVKGTATVPPLQNRYAAFPDSFIFNAQVGSKDSSFGKIWNSGTFGDSVIVDSLRYKSTKNDTAAPFYISDSTGRFVYPDFINKRLNPFFDTLRFVAKFKPTGVGVFKDTMIVYYRFGSSSIYGRLDTIIVKGTATTPPPPQNRYAAFPDSFTLSAQTGKTDSGFGKIWNSGSWSDTVIVDSLRFKSTLNDTALPFLANDSTGRFAYPDYINKRLYPPDTLRYSVKFKPVSIGTYKDTLLIYYRYGNFSVRKDTILIKGIATSPPAPGYDSLRVSIPDTLLVGPKKFPGDTVTLPVVINSIRYNNYNGIYSFQMVLVYNDSLFQCLGYDSSGTVLSNRGGLTEFTVQFRKDSGRGASLDTLRIAGASDDSLYYPEVSGTPFAFPRPLIKLKFRIPTTAHNNDSTILRFTRFMFNEGIPASSTDDGSIKLKLRKKGDVDKNGIIQPYDAVLVLRYVIHDTTLDAESQQAAEVSGNGEITAYDASLILQYFVGKITVFPSGNYYKQSLPSNRGADITLEWGSVQDGTVIISVRAKNLAEVYGYSFELAYDPSVLTYLGQRSSDISKSMTSVVKVENGILRFASAGIEALNGDGALAQLTFRVSGNINQDKIIQIVQAMLNEEIIIARSSSVSKPNAYALEQNYPNPFNPTTQIKYQILESQHVQLIIYNVLGQAVRTLVNELKPAGAYEVQWDGKNDQGINLATGVYIYRIKAGNFISTRKLILMK